MEPQEFKGETVRLVGASRMGAARVATSLTEGGDLVGNSITAADEPVLARTPALSAVTQKSSARNENTITQHVGARGNGQK